MATGRDDGSSIRRPRRRPAPVHPHPALPIEGEGLFGGPAARSPTADAVPAAPLRLVRVIACLSRQHQRRNCEARSAAAIQKRSAWCPRNAGLLRSARNDKQAHPSFVSCAVAVPRCRQSTIRIARSTFKWNGTHSRAGRRDGSGIEAPESASGALWRRPAPVHPHPALPHRGGGLPAPTGPAAWNDPMHQGFLRVCEAPVRIGTRARSGMAAGQRRGFEIRACGAARVPGGHAPPGATGRASQIRSPIPWHPPHPALSHQGRGFLRGGTP